MKKTSTSIQVIPVIQLFTAEERMTRDGGEKLRLSINEHLKIQNKILLDFENVPIASVSFWDEGIAKLLLKDLSLEELKARVIFKNLLPRDQEVIEQLCKARLK